MCHILSDSWLRRIRQSCANYVIDLKQNLGGCRKETDARSRAPGHGERSDPRGRRCCAALQIVADKPERAIVRWIDGDVGVVFPAQTPGLRTFAFGQHRLVEGELSLSVVGQPRGESLAWIIRIAAEGIAKSNVALAIHGQASEPAIETAGRISSLLV